ncbi:MAG: putative diguanylate cyclase (GGDEF)/phosphodiesterase with sensor, signal transduction [Rhizobium sp.]|nr:putative diguanylate cyclase (GGDEF)/phosphodiesterase with sensor, signal transduction [Rhizobium sp.]
MRNPFVQRCRSLFRESNVRFRNKVTLGVGLTLLAAVLSGLNAVYNVRKVEASVNFSAVAASPLLIGVISLSESYQKLQSIFDPVMKDCVGLEGATRYLEQSQDNQRAKLAALKKLAQQADAATELNRYEFSGNKIFKTRQALLDVCHKATTAKSHIAIAQTSLRTTTNLIGIEASMNIIALEDRIANPDRFADPVKQTTIGAILQRSSDTNAKMRDSWKRLRDFYKLKILVTEIVNFGTMLGTANKPFQLERMNKGYWIKIQSVEKSVNDLKDYYESIGRANNHMKLQTLVAETKRMSHLRDDSIFKSQATLIGHERVKQSLVLRLQREQGQYSVALLNIMDVAQRINRNAQLRTEQEANVANIEIAIGVFIAAVLAIVIGWFFKRAVTMPLEALTVNVSNLGLAMRSENDPIDGRLLRRRDEIGDLANQFARTFEALVNARRELQEASRAEISLQRDRLHGAIENMPQGLYMLDRKGRIIIANRRLCDIYNLGAEANLLGMNVDKFIELCRQTGAGVTRTISDQVLSDVDTSGGAYQTSQRVVELDDRRVMTMTVMRLPDGGYVVTHEDITEKQAASEKIAHMAMHDSLTGLANRTLFRTHITEQSLQRCNHSDSALLFLDLDRFKIVNDTLGHPVGDALLVQVATRLRNSIGENCFAARLGGDEFALYQTGVAQPEGASALAVQIIARLAEPFDVNGHHIIIGTSIGIAIPAPDAVDADELSKSADLALYCAKQEGRGQYRFFEADMDRRMRDWHEMEHDLREAITTQQFKLHYQPLVSLEQEAIVGFEALIRWEHPKRGFVSPAEFIPVAEEAGLITELGAWILDTACEQATRWPDDITVAVNISPLQFGSGHLPLTVMSALSKTGLDPTRLSLEITEGVFLNDTDQTMSALDDIKEIGVHFAMDDFGTGYSSLSYIRKFPFNKIKIDQSFVRGMGDDPESLAIVKAVINLCHDLGMITTAEGVETTAQAETLRHLGCGLAQGYLFGRPMPAEATYELLRGIGRKSA